MKDPVGVALIGAGMIAKTHVAALSAAQPLARLDAVVSRRPEKAEHLAETYAGPRPVFTDDLGSIAQNPSIDMAIVATPPNIRREVIEPLAHAGKHILLEKPVARTLDEAQEIVELCAGANVTLGVLFQHRVRASSKAAAQVIDAGDLGPLGQVELAVPLWRPQSYYDELGRGTYARDGGGVLLTNAIHTIDLALSLTGPVAQVQAMTATTPLHKMEAEDFAVAGLRFASGAVGSLVASTATYPHGTERLALHGTRGSLCLTKDTLEIHWRDGRGNPVQRNGFAAPLDGEKHMWHQAMIEDLVGALQTGQEPLVAGYAALQSHQLIAAIETASRTGREVTLP